MVNRIGDGNSYISQPKINREHSVKPGREFSIEYRNEDKDTGTDTGEQDMGEVRVELSTYNKVPEEVVIEPSFISEVKERLSGIKEFLKIFWDRIWNGSPAEDEMEYKEKSISEMNLEEVSNYVSENGHKRLAKNSDILTTYNRHGKIVEINPSEKNKIFHGNKSWKEL